MTPVAEKTLAQDIPAINVRKGHRLLTLHGLARVQKVRTKRYLMRPKRIQIVTDQFVTTYHPSDLVIVL